MILRGIWLWNEQMYIHSSLSAYIVGFLLLLTLRLLAGDCVIIISFVTCLIMALEEHYTKVICIAFWLNASKLTKELWLLNAIAKISKYLFFQVHSSLESLFRLPFICILWKYKGPAGFSEVFKYFQINLTKHLVPSKYDFVQISDSKISIWIFIISYICTAPANPCWFPLLKEQWVSNNLAL